MVFTGGYSNKYPYGSDQCHANKRSEAKQNEENEVDGTKDRTKTEAKPKPRALDPGKTKQTE